MKSKIFLLLVTILLIQCKADSQPFGSIKGEGDVVKQEITLDAIKGVELSFSGDVVLTQGSPQKIVIEGQANIIDNIKRNVRNGVWDIAFEKNVRDAKPVTVYITMPTLTEASLSGSGHIKGTSTFTGLQEVSINVSGSGDIKLALESQSTDVAISGSGGIQLQGRTQSFDITLSGSGNVNAKDFQSTNCGVSISGSGDATVNVNGDLKTDIAGSGDVHYTGNANVKANIVGSGNVSKL